MRWDGNRMPVGQQRKETRRSVLGQLPLVDALLNSHPDNKRRRGRVSAARVETWPRWDFILRRLLRFLVFVAPPWRCTLCSLHVRIFHFTPSNDLMRTWGKERPRRGDVKWKFALLTQLICFPDPISSLNQNVRFAFRTSWAEISWGVGKRKEKKKK